MSVSHLPPPSPLTDGDPDDDKDFFDTNHSLDGRKSVAAFYGDDPDADPEDSNLSALFAQLGAEERLEELGM